MKKLLLFLMFAALSMAAHAQESETIDHVTDDNVVVLQNGNAYESSDSSVSTWNEGDEVLIIDDDKMVNKDQDEAVDVTPTTAPDDPEE